MRCHALGRAQAGRAVAGTKEAINHDANNDLLVLLLPLWTSLRVLIRMQPRLCAVYRCENDWRAINAKTIVGHY